MCTIDHATKQLMEWITGCFQLQRERVMEPCRAGVCMCVRVCRRAEFRVCVCAYALPTNGLILDAGESTRYKHRYHLQYNHKDLHEQFKTNVSQSLTVKLIIRKLQYLFIYRKLYRHRNIELCYRTSQIFLISCRPNMYFMWVSAFFQTVSSGSPPDDSV